MGNWTAARPDENLAVTAGIRLIPADTHGDKPFGTL